MSIRPINIFYCWQSDLPNSVNRGFIEGALTAASERFKVRPSGAPAVVEFTASVDRDTRGRIGTPDIAATIFAKIKACDIFLCDVSIINSSRHRRIPIVHRVLDGLQRFAEASEPRLPPNPNVMAD